MVVEFRPPAHWRLLAKVSLARSTLGLFLNWRHFAAGIEFYPELKVVFVGPLSVGWGRHYEVE